jgi:hypothetical protein
LSLAAAVVETLLALPTPLPLAVAVVGKWLKHF